MDLASRRIVGWSLSARMQADLVCQALKSAYWRRKPAPGLIMHTDRGSQYASAIHRGLIKDYGIVQSMSRKGNCWDNSPMESFFKTLKVERVHQLRYETRAQAKLDVIDWIEGFYNRERMHSSNGYQSQTTLNPASGLHRLVFVKSRQGHLSRGALSEIFTENSRIIDWVKIW